jgi:hypothetical protein
LCNVDVYKTQVVADRNILPQNSGMLLYKTSTYAHVHHSFGVFYGTNRDKLGVSRRLKGANTVPGTYVPTVHVQKVANVTAVT